MNKTHGSALRGVATAVRLCIALALLTAIPHLLADEYPPGEHVANAWLDDMLVSDGATGPKSDVLLAYHGDRPWGDIPEQTPRWLDEEPLPPPLPNKDVFADPSERWTWQILPSGLMYRSYLAGVREPRIGVQYVHDHREGWMWDIALGGRAAVVRCGTTNPIMPDGWELEIEGAGLPRLNFDHHQDLDAVDFRFGIPVVYARGAWRFKAGYYHVSSHLGDEYMLRTPDFDRINYVRDSAFVGCSYYLWDDWRLYGETAYAACSGGAEPWEFQFGVEYSQLRPTGLGGAPFFAIGGNLFQELDFGGRLTVQTGWQWRGPTGHLFRMGMHYQSGAPEQFEFYRRTEDKVGMGMWYDF